MIPTTDRQVFKIFVSCNTYTNTATLIGALKSLFAGECRSNGGTNFRAPMNST